MIPLQSNTDVHVFETNNYNAVYGLIQTSSDLTSDGQVFRIRDKSGYLNTTKLTISDPTNTINGSSTKNLESANSTYMFMYAEDINDIMSL